MSAARRATLRRIGAALACALLPAASRARAAALVTGSGEPAPPLALRDLDGREVRLDRFRGRTLVLNFWATWCVPCVKEMPSLQRLRDRLASEGVAVLLVNNRESAARIEPFLAKIDIDLPVVRDPDGSAHRTWGVRGFPTTFVVSPAQRIGLVAVGEVDWDDPAVLARIRAVGAHGRVAA
jgi:peroxiredoxin